MRKSYLALLLLPLFAAGCISRMAVTKVEAKNADEPGFRYFLPKTYLLVTPAPDGTVTVEKVFLPDPTREYAVTAKAYASKYKLSVQVDEKGLLKKVVWNPSDAESTKAALESAANIQKARIDAEATAAKAEAEKAAKAVAALATAEAAVSTAELEVRIAVAERDKLVELGAPNDKIIVAEVAVEKARLKLLAAQKALADLQTASATSRALDSFRDPAAAQEDRWKIRAWGPVLYEVAEDVDATTGKVTVVALRPVNAQEFLPTSKKLEDPPKVAQVKPRLAIRGSGVLRKSGRPLRFVIESDTQIIAPLNKARVRLAHNGQLLDATGRAKVLTDLNASLNNTITVDIEPDAPTGSYQLELEIQVLEAGKPKSVPIGVAFEVR